MILFVPLIKIVRFVHLQSTSNFLSLFVITYQIPLLTLFIVIFGVPIVFLLLMDINIFLLLLMIVLDQLGFISWSPSLILGPFYSPFILWLKLSSILQSFYTMIKTQFNKIIKIFRTNNGLEFQMTEFFKTHGIIHQHSCVATPQQNSVVERKHQHISCGKSLKNSI